MKRLPLVASFVLFLALCASLAYWGLQLFKPPLRPVAAPPRVANAEVNVDSASSLFGGRAGKADVATNYQLRGIIMSGTASESVAILSADGKPAQAVRAGREVVPGVIVKEVHKDYVLLSDGGASKRVELPESAKAQVNLASNSPLSAPASSPASAAPGAAAQARPSGVLAPQMPAAAAPAAPAAQAPSSAAPGVPSLPGTQQPGAAPTAAPPVQQALPQSSAQSSVSPAAPAAMPATPGTTAPPSMVVNPGSVAAQTGATGTGASSGTPAAPAGTTNTNPAANPALRQSHGSAASAPQ
ncbi:type II secretion system protein N [Noviherbaspirillum massiliense]|uniref:type II secretion system protein N n=1 Tax=Noviherbaspirillum massiliense TaxID=1465823 RepID=UPI0002FBBAD8|nr:type II secretion system protein N [Noviherbaspirillum massiliense]